MFVPPERNFHVRMERLDLFDERFGRRDVDKRSFLAARLQRFQECVGGARLGTARRSLERKNAVMFCNGSECLWLIR